MKNQIIISKTPFRISFFGGGTDFPDYFNSFGGKVLSSSIDKYAYVTLRDLPPYFNHKTQITYSRIERVSELKEIEHPLVRETLKFKGINSVHVVYDADVPAQSGLGTSSSFAVGLLNCISAYQKKSINKYQLAEEAILLERKLCNEAGGYQDQIAASFGGFNTIEFSSSGFKVKKINIIKTRLQQLNENLLLFFTGFSRLSSTVSTHHNNNIVKNYNELNKMKSLVDDALKIIENNELNLDTFGILLHDAWVLKKSFSSHVSNSLIDEIYFKALKAGALGGKILGAGGGGFILLYVNKKNRDNVIYQLKDLVQVPFTFEDLGTRIIYTNQDKVNF
jgi:D-glycero-alpha-D-manno-heptose-7-phosphate kinase